MENDKFAMSMNGITLIALVVTIVVLLILAGVSISMLGGENGIIKQAVESKTEMRAASVQDERDLWMNDRYLSKLTGNPPKTMDDILLELQNKGELTTEEVMKIKSDPNNSIKIGSKTISFQILEPQIGDYVNYIDGKGKKISCRILYNNPQYGIQLVSVNPVDTVMIGYEDPTVPENMESKNNATKAMYSYNNAITTLNNKAEEYRNPTYTDEGGARCIGSVPNDPNSESRRIWMVWQRWGYKLY